VLNAQTMPPARALKANRSPTQRSRVSNGAQLFLGDIDERSALARRFRDLFSQFLIDAGGPDGLSEAQHQLGRRAATLCVQCEHIESRAMSGDEIDLEQYGMLCDRLGRCLQRLGLKRVAKDITLHPLDYAKSNGRVKAAAQ
jgi:hypothetical protein